MIIHCDAPNSAHSVKRVCHFFFPVYYKLINFKFVHSYNVKHLTCYIFCSSILQNIYKLHIWKFSTFTKTLHLFINNKKNITYTKIDQKVLRCASNYVLTLETDEGCLAFLPLLSYLHG